eukprot:43800_1
MDVSNSNHSAVALLEKARKGFCDITAHTAMEYSDNDSDSNGTPTDDVGTVVEIGNPPTGFVEKLESLGFAHETQADINQGGPVTMDRSTYSATFGPTKGDRIRLGDTMLVVEIEEDKCTGPNGEFYGDEVKFGGGKVLRDGLGQASGLCAADALDTVITNAVVLDYTGIYKADIGIKDGMIVVIGKAGNPDTMDGVDPDLYVGVTT